MLGRRVPAPIVSEGHPLGTGKYFILRRPRLHRDGDPKSIGVLRVGHPVVDRGIRPTIALLLDEWREERAHVARREAKRALPGSLRHSGLVTGDVTYSNCPNSLGAPTQARRGAPS